MRVEYKQCEHFQPAWVRICRCELVHFKFYLLFVHGYVGFFPFRSQYVCLVHCLCLSQVHFIVSRLHSKLARCGRGVVGTEWLDLLVEGLLEDINSCFYSKIIEICTLS